MYILVNLHKHSWKRRDDVGENRVDDYDEEEEVQEEEQQQRIEEEAEAAD